MYINTTSRSQPYGLVPGDSYPVTLKTWPKTILNGFSQVTRMSGTISDTPYSLRLPNSQSRATNFSDGNRFNNTPEINQQIFSPTIFNIDNVGGGGANTHFATVTAGASQLTIGGTDYNPVTVSPAADDTDSKDYVVSLDTTQFENAVQAAESNAASDGFGIVVDNSGNSINASGPDDNINIAGDYNSTDPQGSGSYINTDKSGADTLKVEFKRNLFENFTSDDSNVLTASAQNSTLDIAGGTGISTEASGSTITVGLTEAIHSYSTIQTDDTSISADEKNQTLKLTNNTTNTVVKDVLVIDGNNASPGGTDEVRFSLTPVPHAGFGTQLARITEDLSIEGGISSINILGVLVYYYKYKASVGTADGLGNSSSNFSHVTGKEIWDFGFNSFNQVITPNIGYVHKNPTSLTDSGATLVYAPYSVSDIVLVQQISSNRWVFAGPSQIKAICP
tara:strand:+ start:11853 stop:13202 length:1350 start_codon:yes stop_codon:yes gene_type:complete